MAVSAAAVEEEGPRRVTSAEMEVERAGRRRAEAEQREAQAAEEQGRQQHDAHPRELRTRRQKRHRLLVYVLKSVVRLLHEPTQVLVPELRQRLP